MNILMVHPQMEYYGGAELLVVKLSNFLFKTDGVAIITTKISEQVRKDLDPEIRVIEIGKVYSSGIRDIIRQIITLTRSIKDVEDLFDIINYYNFPAELIAAKVKKPSVWYCNEPPIYWLNPEARFQQPHELLLEFEKRIVRRHIKRACVADEFNACRFKERYGFQPDIIPYGIDYDFFSKGDANRAIELYNLKNKFVILQVGVITPQKNQLRSIQVVDNLKEKIPNIKLILAGNCNGYYVHQLMDYVTKKGLNSFVIFLGNIERETLRDLYAACDVLLHPIKSQGGWLSPFECMCLGKPVVVSPEFTGSTIISYFDIGIVAFDDFEYEMIIEDIYKHPKELSHGKQGRDWVKENLTWERFGKGMLQIFEKVSKNSK